MTTKIELDPIKRAAIIQDAIDYPHGGPIKIKLPPRVQDDLGEPREVKKARGEK